jgi:predicted XRE-type DNA-binding protein
MSEDIIYKDGGENVFADIGVRDPEDSLVRARLAKEIAEIIRSKGLRQNEIAERLGVDQSKVSKLVRGRISGFTSDRLLRYLNALGCNVKIEVSRAEAVHTRGKVVVIGV